MLRRLHAVQNTDVHLHVHSITCCLDCLLCSRPDEATNQTTQQNIVQPAVDVPIYNLNNDFCPSLLLIGRDLAARYFLHNADGGRRILSDSRLVIDNEHV